MATPHIHVTSSYVTTNKPPAQRYVGIYLHPAYQYDDAGNRIEERTQLTQNGATRTVADTYLAYGAQNRLRRAALVYSYDAARATAPASRSSATTAMATCWQ